MSDVMLHDILAAGALVLVLEGLAYALFPEQMRKLIVIALQQQPDQLRIVGVITMALGVGCFWLIRG